MKTQYKAIIASAVVVMLCLSAIGGITYSWFSDSEQSEINVTTGKIDLTITPGDVTVKSYGGSDKTIGTDGTIITDLNGKVTVSKTSGSSSALSIAFENAVPGDILSFKLERSIVNSINVAYVESCQVSSGGKILSTYPFIIDGIDTVKKNIGTNDAKYVIKDGIITIEFDKNAGSSEMGKSYSILLLFQAYQANAPVSDITTTTIKSGDNVIGVNPESGLSSATTISFDGTGISNKDITLTAVDTTDATYALSGSSPLAGISVNSDASFIGKDVNVSFVLPGNVSKNELTITHNGDTVWNGSTGTITAVDATYDVAANTTTVSFTTALGFSYYAVYNTAAVAIGSNGSFYNSLAEAVNGASDGATITVLKDNNEGQIGVTDSRSITIDLNNHTISFNNCNRVVEISQGSIVFVNGTIDSSTAKAAFYAERGASITVDNVIVKSSNSGFFPRGDASTINIENSQIIADAWGVATNAGNADNYNVVINIKNSTISAAIPAMINVAGQLNIDSSILNGKEQCLIVRAGTAAVNNTSMEYSMIDEGKYNTAWGSNGNNNMTSAAIIVGNLSATSYNADASLQISNSVVNTTDSKCITLVIAQDHKNGQNASITITDSPSVLSNAYKANGTAFDKITGNVTETYITVSVITSKS